MNGVRTISQILIKKNKLKQMANEDDPKDDKSEERINIDEALWDQNTYIGRWKQMAFISDIRTIFVSKEELLEAKKLCDDYALGHIGPEDIKEEDIIYAKKLYDSAFHPDNEELMNTFGRMSFQLPGNAILLMALMTFYKSAPAILGLQILNQAFNAIVNYTNRSIQPDESNESVEKKAEDAKIIIGQTLLFSGLASVVAALGFKKLLLCKGPILARLIPLGGVTIGNFVNLAVIRKKEHMEGIPVSVIQEEPFMNSQIAAVKATSELYATRMLTVAPTMIMIPAIAGHIKSTCFYYRRPWVILPIELSLCLASLLVMIPSALALFPWCNSMKSELLKLCPEEYNKFIEKITQEELPDKVYYSKGL